MPDIPHLTDSKMTALCFFLTNGFVGDDEVVTSVTSTRNIAEITKLSTDTVSKNRRFLCERFGFLTHDGDTSPVFVTQISLTKVYQACNGKTTLVSRDLLREKGAKRAVISREVNRATAAKCKALAGNKKRLRELLENSKRDAMSRHMRSVSAKREAGLSTRAEESALSALSSETPDPYVAVQLLLSLARILDCPRFIIADAERAREMIKTLAGMGIDLSVSKRRIEKRLPRFITERTLSRLFAKMAKEGVISCTQKSNIRKIPRKGHARTYSGSTSKVTLLDPEGSSGRWSEDEHRAVPNMMGRRLISMLKNKGQLWQFWTGPYSPSSLKMASVISSPFSFLFSSVVSPFVSALSLSCDRGVRKNEHLLSLLEKNDKIKRGLPNRKAHRHITSEERNEVADLMWEGELPASACEAFLLIDRCCSSFSSAYAGGAYKACGALSPELTRALKYSRSMREAKKGAFRDEMEAAAKSAFSEKQIRLLRRKASDIQAAALYAEKAVKKHASRYIVKGAIAIAFRKMRESYAVLGKRLCWEITSKRRLSWELFRSVSEWVREEACEEFVSIFCERFKRECM